MRECNSRNRKVRQRRRQSQLHVHVIELRGVVLLKCYPGNHTEKPYKPCLQTMCQWGKGSTLFPLPHTSVLPGHTFLSHFPYDFVQHWSKGIPTSLHPDTSEPGQKCGHNSRQGIVQSHPSEVKRSLGWTSTCCGDWAPLGWTLPLPMAPARPRIDAEHRGFAPAAPATMGGGCLLFIRSLTSVTLWQGREKSTC